MRTILIFLFTAFALFSEANVGFVENKGQWPNDVLFACDIQEGKLFILKQGYRIHQWDLSGMHHAEIQEDAHPNDVRIKGHVFDVLWQSNNLHSFAMGMKLLESKSNFYLGNDQSQWAKDCRSFLEVIQLNVYPGIDLSWRLDGKGGVKYEWHIHKNGSASLISWKFVGVDEVTILKNEMSIRHSLGMMKDDISDCYLKQNDEWRKIDADIHFYKNNNGLFSFRNVKYEHKEWIIDPQLIFSTYSGSASDNFGYTATYDHQGYLYSGSSAFGQGYPTTLGAYQTTWAGGDGSGSLAGTDIALTKYSTDGTQLIWSTFIGGDRDELPHSLVVNGQNELYMYGSTGSYNFPVTSNGFDTTFNAGIAFTPQGIGTTYAFGSDVILCRFSVDGSSLLYSTYFGGSGNDGVNTAVGLKNNYADEFRGEIDISPSNEVVIVGTTNSLDFPTTMNGGGGLQDVFLAKWSADLSQLIWCRKWGGSDDESGCSVAFDQQDNIWLTGGTQSLDISISNNANQMAFGGGTSDGWLAKFSFSGNVVASSYWGSSAYDQLYFIDTDEEGFPYVYGQSLAPGSTWVNNAAWSQPNSGMYVAKWNTDLSSVIWSTVFGSGSGVPNLSPSAFLVDVCGQIYLSGWGGSVNQMSNANVGNTQGLWISNNAYQSTTNGSDFYLLVIDESAEFAVYGSYFGGGVSSEHVDGGTSRFDRKGVIYQSVCAGCGSHDDFPIYPPNAWSPINGSNNCNNGVFKFDFELPLTYVNANFIDEVCLGDTVSFLAQVQQATSLQWMNITSGELISTSQDFNYTFQDTGLYFIQLVGSDPLTCNGVDSSGHWIHVRGPQNVNLPDLNLCFGDTVFVGIQNPQVNAIYEWINGVGILNDSVYWSPYEASINESITLLQLGNTCTDTIRQNVSVTQVDLSLTDNLALCNPQIVDIEAQFSPTNAVVNWYDSNSFSNEIGSGNHLVWQANQNATLYAQAILNGCEMSDSVFVQVLSVQSSQFESQVFCSWDTVSITVPNPIVQCDYQWSENGQIISPLNSASVEITPIESSWYYLTTSIPGCEVLDSVFIEASALNQNVIALQANPSVIGVGGTATVAISPDGYDNQWSIEPISEDPNSSSAVFQLYEDTWIEIVVFDGNCRLTDSVFIKVERVLCSEPFIYVPNVFTPNNDGLHDDIGIQSSLDLKGIWMIRDRMGQEVFKTSNLRDRWSGLREGQVLQSGVYHYYLKAECPGGYIWEKEGNITLMNTE